MGSIGRAIMTGFICRLCSKQKKIVVHLYTAKARKMDLMSKIRVLPIKVEKYDNLPKTICEACIEKLEMQYDLLTKIRRNDNVYKVHVYHHSHGRCPDGCPLREWPDEQPND